MLYVVVDIRYIIHYNIIKLYCPDNSFAAFVKNTGLKKNNKIQINSLLKHYVNFNHDKIKE